MAEIIVSQTTELENTKLRQLALRVVREMELAAQKAVLHQAQPNRFPIPADERSMEQLFVARFRELQPAKQQAAIARIQPLIVASAAQHNAILRNLAPVNFQSSVPIVTQIDQIGLPVPLRNLKLADLLSPTMVAPTPAASTNAQAHSRLQLRIHQVICDDETNGLFGSEAGDDEIALGGSTVSATGKTGKVASFTVRNDFDDGERQVYTPPRSFTVFDLKEGDDFPKTYFVTLVLAEKDMGGLDGFINRLVEAIRERVISAISVAIGGTIGSGGGPLGTIIGAAVGFAVGKLFELLKSAFSDDVFPPATVKVSIPSRTALFSGGKTDSPEATAKFSGHGGSYRIIYDWRVLV